jgi:predicted nucleic acid-binding protein
VVLVDTSVWIDLLRDPGGAKAAALRKVLGGEEAALTRFTELELLQGCADERTWLLMREYLDSQAYLDMSQASWAAAARMYFDLRRLGRTVRSSVDCCIAQIAIDHEVLLLHRDADFERIAGVSRLSHAYLTW